MAASTSLGRLLVELALDSTGLKSGLTAAVGEVKRAANEIATGGKSLSANFGAALRDVGVVAAGVAGALGALGAGAIRTGAEFESIRARLETLTGSSVEARKRLDDLFAISQTTPFTLQQLSEAEVTLEAFGADAPKWRGAVMDLAGALGMDLNDAAGAVGRALTAGAGAADILRERGVLAMVELRTGVKPTTMSLGEFRDALFETLTDPDGRIAGGTERLGKTFAGLVSNLQDAWTAFLKLIADNTFFAASKGFVAELIVLWNENQRAVADLTAEIGTGLTAALMLSVQGVGAIVDGFDAVRLGVTLVELAVAAVVNRLAGGVADVIAAVETVNARLGDPLHLSGEIAEAWRLFAGVANEAARQVAATGADAQVLWNQLGRGSEFAERMARAMEAAQSGGHALADGVERSRAALQEASDAAVKAEQKRAESVRDLVADIAEALGDASTKAAAFEELERRALGAQFEADLADDVGQVLALSAAIEALDGAVGRATVAEAMAAWRDELEAVQAEADAIDVSALEDGIKDLEDLLDRQPTGLWDAFRAGADSSFAELKEHLGETYGLFNKLAEVAGAAVGAAGGAASAALGAAAAVTGGLDLSVGGLVSSVIEAAGGGAETARENRQAVADARAALAEAEAGGDAGEVAAAKEELSKAEAKPQTAKAAAREAIRQQVQQAVAFVRALAANLDVVIRALVKAIPKLVDALVEGIPDIVSALVAHAPEIAVAIAVGLARALWAAIKGLFTGIASWFTDTPGVVKAGGDGLMARFAPGDLVVAAQRPSDLVAGALQALAGSGRPTHGAAPSARASGAVAASPPVVVSVTAEGQVLEAVMVKAGERGHAPRVHRALRRTRGVHVGLDRGRFASWAP